MWVGESLPLDKRIFPNSFGLYKDWLMRFVRHSKATKVITSYCAPVWHCRCILESSYVKPRCWRRAIRIQREEANWRKYFGTCFYHTVRSSRPAMSGNDDAQSVHSAYNSKRAAQIPAFAEFMTRLVYQSQKRRLQFFRVVLGIQRRKCKRLSTIDRYITFKRLVPEVTYALVFSCLFCMQIVIPVAVLDHVKPYAIFALREKQDLLARYLSYGGMIQSKT